MNKTAGKISLLSGFISAIGSLLISGLLAALPAYAEKPGSEKGLSVVQLVSRDSPPFSWYDAGQKRYLGSIFFLQEKVFKELELAMDLEQLDYNDAKLNDILLLKLKHGEMDVLVGSDRRAELDSSILWLQEPLVELQVSLFVRAGERFVFSGWDSLRGKVGVIVSQPGRKGFYTKLSPVDFEHMGLQLETAATHQQAIQWLLKGRADYWATDSFIGNGLITTLKLSSQLDVVEQNLVSVPLYIGFAKDSDYVTLMPSVERQLQQMRASGQIDHIRQRFMQEFINSQVRSQ